MDARPTKGVAAWAIALRKVERYIELRHVNVHWNTALISLEGDWNQ